MNTALYTCKVLPIHWVVGHEGKLWIVPAKPNGWKQRSPYRGYKQVLEKVPNYNAMGLGLPE